MKNSTYTHTHTQTQRGKTGGCITCFRYRSRGRGASSLLCRCDCPRRTRAASRRPWSAKRRRRCRHFRATPNSGWIPLLRQVSSQSVQKHASSASWLTNYLFWRPRVWQYRRLTRWWRTCCWTAGKWRPIGVCSPLYLQYETIRVLFRDCYVSQNEIPDKVCRHLPLIMSHTLTVESALPETSILLRNSMPDVKDWWKLSSEN